MTRRHDFLIPLTHDHHHALAQARRLRIAAGAAPHERTAAAAQFIRLFDAEILDHFRMEEETIFPLVIDRIEAESALVRVMMEHLRMHAAIDQLRKEVAVEYPDTSTLERVADLFVDHIRFEEKELFPLIERLAHTELALVDMDPYRTEEIR